MTLADERFGKFGKGREEGTGRRGSSNVAALKRTSRFCPGDSREA